MAGLEVDDLQTTVLLDFDWRLVNGANRRSVAILSPDLCFCKPDCAHDV